jgi:large subunit ribosomal protein L17
MRHGNKNRKLGRKSEHRHALMKNLCRALFIFEKIKTTLPKAKEARKLAERLVQFAKQNDLAAKRHIYRFIPDHKLVKIVCEDIGPKFAKREGGYTRITRLGPRLGDGAEMAFLELTELSKPDEIVKRRKLIERRQLGEGETKKSKKEKPKKEKPRKEEKPKKDEKPKKEEKSKKEEPKEDKNRGKKK